MVNINHLGIIMDGNRRWARSKGLPSIAGHQAGYEAVKKIVPAVFERGIQVLTLFAFSTENWNRGKEEVDCLMKLFSKAIQEQIKKLTNEGVRIRFIGDTSAFPKVLQQDIAACKATNNTKSGKALNMAINYGGRAEIVSAVRKIASEGTIDDISEELISANTYTAGLPDPDLIIRTSGEQRTSGFLTWQSAYSELYFSHTYWPDFTPEDLDLALVDYAKRQRRFGA